MVSPIRITDLGITCSAARNRCGTQTKAFGKRAASC